MRLDGQGRVLRERGGDQSTGDGATWDTLTAIHTSLLAVATQAPAASMKAALARIASAASVLNPHQSAHSTAQVPFSTNN